MKTFLGVVFLLFFSAFWAFNAVFMLLFPRRWLQLPFWYSKGSASFLAEYKNASEVELISLRLLGAVFFGVFAWMAYGALTH